MDRWPASSPQPAVAAMFRALVVVALVVPMDRGMVMTDYDELCEIAQAIVDAPVDQRWALIPDLRAALAARPQPLHLPELSGEENDYPDGGLAGWVPPRTEPLIEAVDAVLAVADEPTEMPYVLARLRAARTVAAAGSAAPTGDDDA